MTDNALHPATEDATTSVVRRRRGQPQKEHPRPASRQAQRLAAAILDVLAGGRTPVDAAAALGMSPPRYYLLEQRALAGLVAACEPRPPGQTISLKHRIAVLEKELLRARQECARQQALVRAAQRTVGLAPPPAKPVAKSTGKRPRKRRPTVRALKAAAALRATDIEEPPANSYRAVPPEVLQLCSGNNAPPPRSPSPPASADARPVHGGA